MKTQIFLRCPFIESFRVLALVIFGIACGALPVGAAGLFVVTTNSDSGPG